MTGLYYNEVTIEEVKQLNEANMKTAQRQRWEKAVIIGIL